MVGRFWVPSHVLRARGGRVAHSSPWLKPAFPCTAPGPSFYQRSVDLWEICHLPWDLPSCTDTLGQTLSGCATRRTDPRCSHLPWERSNPRNQGEKDRFHIAHPAIRSPCAPSGTGKQVNHHFPKEAALQVQKVTPKVSF